MPRAAAFRLLCTLRAARFVTRAGGEYQLGLKCFMLGNIAAADLDLCALARPHLAVRCDLTRETCRSPFWITRRAQGGRT
jgi:DNA-binding IclR family transcriptional regulator